MIMERKVGEIFEYNGEWYQCIHVPQKHSCKLCDLRGLCCDNNGVKIVTCVWRHREDNTSVIFKKLEKDGVPFVYEDKVLQRLRSIDGYSCVHCLFKEQACNFDSCDKDSFLIETKLKLENMEEKKLTYEELEHYYDSTCGLWAIDRNPKEVTFEWIVENVFQLGDTIPEKVCASNLKPFDLEAAKAGKPVCTRDGRKARIISFDRHGEDCPIIALVVDSKNAECEEVIDYTLDGICNENIINHNKYDLMMFPQKKEGWINIYTSYDGIETGISVYETKEIAKKGVDNSVSYLGTIKIEWEE
jgi:hypothetical protein